MLHLPCLMLVTDRAACGGAEGLVVAVDQALSGGVNAVQLREKDMPRAELRSLALRLRRVTRGRALLLVNGDAQVAVAVGAEGVHLPEYAPAVARPRKDFLVGRSVHSVEAARRAEAQGADYIVAGPVYETPSHPDAPAAGPNLIEAAVRAVGVPVLAIGGVTEGRVNEVTRAGASGVAVISAILAAEKRRAAALGLRQALDTTWVRVRTAQ